MLARLGEWADRSTRTWNPWTNAVGLVRTILALATLITLAFNDADVLYPLMPSSAPRGPYCDGAHVISAFCLVPTSGINVVRWLSVGALIVVASGWRPRFTGIFLAWIAYSLAVTSPVLDGGDQIASELSILILPISLCDPRVWHWQAPPDATARPYARIVSWVASAAASLQVAGIYFHAAVGKTAADDWANGTALYYWIREPYFGATGLAAKILFPITSNGVLCALFTWGVLLLEFLLAAAIVMPRRPRPWLLAAGIALHLGILWIHGLFSFGLTMVAALVLYLRPLGSEIPFGAWALGARRLLATAAEPENQAEHAPLERAA